MAVTDREVARIPPGNIRVPRALFAAVWRAALQRDHENAERGVQDWYAGAVVVTCRWLACTTVRSFKGQYHLAQSPVTRRTERAYEELIEAETIAAENLPLRRPGWLTSRPGLCEGVRDTLVWAWRGEGPPPLHVAAGTASSSPAV